MRFNLFVFVVLLLLSAQLMAVSVGSSDTLHANVVVICPFYLSANVLPVYTIGSDINLNYTLFTQAVCSISDLQGTFTLEYSSNNVQVMYNSLPVTTAMQTPATYSLAPINSMALQRDSYKAIFAFSAYGTNNQSVKTFTLVSQSNVVVENFTVSPTAVSAGSPLTFTANILNDGELASGPIGVNIVITGPQNTTISESASALSPGQSEILTFVLGNVTGAAGDYTANLYANFVFSNTIIQSNMMNAVYSVIAPPAPSHGAPPSTGGVIASVPRLALTQVPFYSSLAIGSTDITSLGLENTANMNISVSLGVPLEYDNIFDVSAHSIYLVPSESVLVQLVFDSSHVSAPGTYVVPLNISVSAPNSVTMSRTQYLTYVVSKGSYNVSMYNQIQTALNNATVTTSLVGARNTSLTNSTLVTMLPSSIVNNASQIKTYGLPATITFGAGGPQINWLVPYLPEGKGITLSYTIANPKNIGLLSSVENLLIVQSRPAPTSILRVVNIQTPTFYANMINQVDIGVLYTGTLQQDIKFTMTTTGSATVLNPVQFINAAPNQLLQQTFNIKTENTTGTLLLSLNIESQNASVNYTLPVIVMQKNIPATTTTPQATTSGISVAKYVPWIVGAVVVCFVILLIRGIGRKPRYQAGRAKELIRIREQIKRSDEHA